MSGFAGKLFRRNPVPDTDEFRRVLGLSRRDWRQGVGMPPEELAAEMTELLKRPGGTMKLFPVQAIALAELHDFGGLFAPIAVGGGKTAISALSAKVVDAKRPVLLIPAKLREKTRRDFLMLQEHFVFPEVTVESYTTLSRIGSKGFLESIQPDLLILDEAHHCKHLGAGVSSRVNKYMNNHPETTCVAMSGTFTRKSIQEYWHILRWCLKSDWMPLPDDWAQMMLWADCLDAGNHLSSTGPGALVHLCNEEEERRLEGGITEAVEACRLAYRRRLTDTPGVISTGEDQVACSLIISEVKVELDHLNEMFEKMRRTFETPDGHPFAEGVDLWRHARELACGFFYRWRVRPPAAWLKARKDWCRFVRNTLKHSHRFETELEIVRAMQAGGMRDYGKDEFDEPVTPFATWQEVKGTFDPQTEPVWVDDTVLNVAKEWMDANMGIAWVEHVAVGKKLAELSGRPYYGQGGIDAKTKRSIETEKQPCIASIAANAEGRNLQRYSKNLIVSCPPSGATFEQLLGRMHRTGQQADEVSFEVILGCKEQGLGFWKAIEDAKYIHQTTGMSQKLLFADIAVRSREDIELGHVVSNR